jgi:hypothetical protein
MQSEKQKINELSQLVLEIATAIQHITCMMPANDKFLIERLKGVYASMDEVKTKVLNI